MSSSHSPHGLLLLLPLQKSSSCNCQYKLIKNNTNYYNHNINNNINNNNFNNKNKQINYNNYNNKNTITNKIENILLWILLISTTPTLLTTSTAKTTTTTTTKTKQNLSLIKFIILIPPAREIVQQTSLSSSPSSSRVQTVNTTATQTASSTTTYTRSIDVQYTKSLKLLLRTLTGFLILLLISLNLQHLRRRLLLLLPKAILLRLNEFLLNSLSEKDLVLDKIFNIRQLWWSYKFCVHPTISQQILKNSSSAAYNLTQPEEAFKSSLLLSRTSAASSNLSIKGLFCPSTTSQPPQNCHQYCLRFLLQG